MELIVATIVLVTVAILAILLQWLNVFIHYPFHASIRAFIGLLTLLVGAVAVPVSINGKVDTKLGGIIITNESSEILHVIAFVCITLLLSICFFQIAEKTPKTTT